MIRDDDEREPEPEELELTSVPGSTDEAVFPLIPNYTILQRVGEGGMGEVFEAEQLKPVRRKVALKVIKHGMDSKQVVMRFESERQALAVMNHPNISRVFDAGTTRHGRPYFAMEYVKGVPITTYCDRYRLGLAQRLALFMQVCEGLQHAHQKGIIHRDIKPSNVLVQVEGGDQPVPKIIDFGIAKATERRLAEEAAFTEMGQLVGTPEYMSPEQAEMTLQDIDTRTDVYSLGVLLYELLVGKLPFDPAEMCEHGFDEFRRQIREDEPSRPSAMLTTLGEGVAASAHARRTDPASLKKRLRGDLDWITLKALEKDRTRRYGSPSELAADIGRYLEDLPVQARPPSTSYRVGKFVRRHKVGVASAAALLILLIAFAAAMTFQTLRIAQERNRANEQKETAMQLAQVLDELFHLSDPGTARGSSITARELLDSGLEKVRRSLSDKPRELARYLGKIGDYYVGLGQYEDAEPLLKEALQLRQEQLRPQHPDTLESMSALGKLYRAQGNYDEALPLMRDTLAGRREELGADDPATLESMNDLAGLYRNLSGFEDAEQLYLATLRARERVLGKDHVDTAETMNDLGLLYYDHGSLDQAEPLIDGALEIYDRRLSDDHPNTLHAMNNLALIYDDQGREADAEPLYVKIIAAQKRVLGADHPDTLTAMQNLAGLYSGQERYDEAEPLYVEAVAVMQESMGRDNPFTLLTMGSLGQLYTRTGRPEKAEPLLVEAVAAMRRTQGDKHYFTGVNVRKYGACLTALERYDEAERALLEAYQTLSASLGVEHEQTVYAVEELVRLYEVSGQPEKLSTWRARLQGSS